MSYECFVKRPHSVNEDSSQFALDQWKSRSSEWPQGKSVLHFVYHVGSKACPRVLVHDRGELVFMHPCVIGPPDLNVREGCTPSLIDSLEGRVPLRDFSPPPEWYPIQFQTVINLGPGFHLNWCGRDNGELERWRSNALEICGVSKEVEHFFEWPFDVGMGAQKIRSISK